MTPTRDEALALLRRHNKDEGHIRHALALEACMRHFALRFNGDENRWGVVGLLHDLDWEETQSTPEHHTAQAVVWLQEADCDADIVRAVRSHAWGLLQEDVPPETPMEKILYTVDELSGFVTAVALVRPSHSLLDLETKSVIKKWKDKAFARGVDRHVIIRGAALLEIPLETLIEEVIAALRPIESTLGLGNS